MIRLVAITDRRRADPLRTLGKLSLEGVAIQVREKDLDGRALLALVRDVMTLGAPVWVNDRADVALLAGAHGVHLPEAGLAIADVPAGLAIGVSRHAPISVPGVQLIQLGPIFATPGKGPPLGPRALSYVAGAPVVAVGGIDTPEKAAACLAAGASAVAVIRAALDPALFADILAACTTAPSCVKASPYPPL